MESLLLKIVGKSMLICPSGITRGWVAPTAGAGLVFNAQERRHFYSAMVFPATNTFKVIKVIEKPTALVKEAPVIPKKIANGKSCVFSATQT